MLRAGAFALLATFLIGTALQAGEEPPPANEPPSKPWRPFQDLPEVLWYEDFDTETKNYAPGKWTEGAPALTGHCMELGVHPHARNEKVVYVEGKVNSPLKMPGGLNPTTIFIQFMVWVEDSGDFRFKVRHASGEYEEKIPITKEKQWTPFTCRFSDLRAKGNRVEPDHITRSFEILFKPRDPKAYKKAYIDDLVITTGVRPPEVLGRLMAARKAIVDVTKVPSKDGFSFSVHAQDQLKTIVKGNKGKPRKPKSVLVMGARETETDELIKALNAAAPKIKATGFQFVPCSGPDELPAYGLDDMRTLLPFALQKDNPEVVLLMLSAADAFRPGRASESVKVILERTLEAGAIPIVCLPASAATLDKKDKPKVDGFITSVGNVCLQLGVPFVDSNVAIKGAQNPFDKIELSSAGLESVGGIAAQVLKHLDAYLFARKG
ncbi:MAG TPA: hypothetical protein VEK08_15610 [Planctomycetota bacterium]|nr:hypothetical protein [Planctomycetota bacterium]